MYFGDTVISEVNWELDDRARTTQQALAAISIEDHMRDSLRIEHKVIADEPCDECKEEEKDSKKNEDESVNTDAESETTDEYVEAIPDIETGRSCDSTVQDYSYRELNRVEDWSEID